MLLSIRSIRPLLSHQPIKLPPWLAAAAVTTAIPQAILTKLPPKAIVCRYTSSFPSKFTRRNHQYKARTAKALGPEKPTPPEEFISLDGPFPFHIQRSSKENIPVYNMRRQKAALSRTCIRNVTGDRHALGRIVQQQLKIPREDIIIKARTSHVLIRGLLREKVRDLLKQMGV